MKSVLVTGANGLLGTNVVLELLGRGYAVKGLVRSRRRFIDYSHPQLELVTGDVRDVSSLQAAVKGCDFIVHTAADTSQKHLRISDYDPVNLEGTKNILKLCRQEGIKRMVCIGTANTCGYGSRENPGDEQSPPAPPFTRCLYALSKIKAAKLIDAAVSEGLDIVTISPTFMIGPYDYKPSSGRIINMVLNRKVVFYPPGGKNFVHATDVARGVVNALVEGESGENYLMANENLSYREFFQIISRLTGKRPLMIPLSRPLLMAAGLVGDGLRRLGVEIPLSSNNMKILCVNNFYKNQKALSRFNMSFLTTEEAVRDALKTGPFQTILKY
ncbi:MAG TPA: NAD-dependent epimerase/dehydratase family protein [Bacteroidales bacterium]|nr:MAG: 3 beta-hydroxysteroid dehydrogenase/Delta 5-->4-isomerase [Bacteroidetes bacterium ADurb.Bin139]HOG25265.1 NAD-dependent epimerase/dehydratase family protein [Bacteroidales bacterium]HOR11159.1 NAD-dependent epimerase/dehydratase family protein [Bacteroidales bacterium]HPK38681.1 NAD-dependent epimerase/dehydratase family protein [Bacteroidales bacterium]